MRNRHTFLSLLIRNHRRCDDDAGESACGAALGEGARVDCEDGFDDLFPSQLIALNGMD